MLLTLSPFGYVIVLKVNLHRRTRGLIGPLLTGGLPDLKFRFNGPRRLTRTFLVLRLTGDCLIHEKSPRPPLHQA
jgi:hypothetical protein